MPNARSRYRQLTRKAGDDYACHFLYSHASIMTLASAVLRDRTASVRVGQNAYAKLTTWEDWGRIISAAALLPPSPCRYDFRLRGSTRALTEQATRRG